MDAWFAFIESFMDAGIVSDIEYCEVVENVDVDDNGDKGDSGDNGDNGDNGDSGDNGDNGDNALMEEDEDGMDVEDDGYYSEEDS